MPTLPSCPIQQEEPIATSPPVPASPIAENYSDIGRRLRQLEQRQPAANIPDNIIDFDKVDFDIDKF